MGDIEVDNCNTAFPQNSNAPNVSNARQNCQINVNDARSKSTPCIKVRDTEICYSFL